MNQEKHCTGDISFACHSHSIDEITTFRLAVDLLCMSISHQSCSSNPSNEICVETGEFYAIFYFYLYYYLNRLK